MYLSGAQIMHPFPLAAVPTKLQFLIIKIRHLPGNPPTKLFAKGKMFHLA